MKIPLRVLAPIVLLALVAAGVIAYRRLAAPGLRTARVIGWIRAPQEHPEWAVSAGERCGEAPFLQPSHGFIGYLWGDVFRIGARHQGLDIFGGNAPGVTPVYAAYPGYLTRLPEWKSTVILRIPSDPLHPGRQIWTYYTHLADPQGKSFIAPEFPPGTEEVFVPAGTLLGYQGNYSGDSANPVGVHLHFSIVRDDGQGRFTDERRIANTLDPSPYFNLPLNADTNRGEIPVCPTPTISPTRSSS